MSRGVAGVPDGVRPCPLYRGRWITAAFVAAGLPGAQAITSAYVPDFLTEDGGPALPDDLAPLAVRALDRVAGPDSEWRDLWQDSDQLVGVLADLATLRSVLAG